MCNVRLLRPLIFALVIILLLLAGGGAYLWFVGGKMLGQNASSFAITNQSAVASQEPTYLPTPSYNLKDIAVSKDGGEQALKDYSHAVAEIMSVYSDKAIENELKLAVEAAQTGDPATIAKIAESATRHGEASLRLKALIVPVNVAQVHLNLVNSLIGLAEASYLMSTIKETPVVALTSAQYTYPERLKNFFTAVNNLNFFLLASDVVLPPAERVAISLGL